MRTISDYTIFCTVEQSRRAYKLGAPISIVKSKRTKETILADDVIEFDDDTFTYIVPSTTQQMFGWLEEQEDIREITVFRIYDGSSDSLKWVFEIRDIDAEYIVDDDTLYESKSSAISAAINAALDYLERKKNTL